MITLIAFWIVLTCSLIFYFISLKYKTVENIVPVLVFLAGSFLIVAIATKDPLFTTLGVPVEFEWVVGLFLTGLSSWKLYFSPLKERVIKTEKEIISTKYEISSIKSEISSIKSEVSSIKDDTNIIKEKLMCVKTKSE